MAGTSASTRRGRGGIGRVVVGVAIALLVLVILLAAFLASPLFERVLRTRVLAAASERFERSLTLRKARASLVPLVVRVEDFTLQGLGDDPILRADRIALRVRVWPTLRTLGRTIALAVVRVEGGEANLMRLPDGSWDLPTRASAERRSRTPSWAAARCGSRTVAGTT